MLIYFASGACSLIDEVVWVRLLKLTLGNTVYATSIVVSIFMGGLAVGALIMGRYCDRIKRHLRLYALLEGLVTISALSLPLGLKLADTVYVWFYRAYHPTHWQLLVVQVVISAAILLVPSMLMGSTLPLLGRFVTVLERETGHLVGKLYALNTLGAAAGCFLAGFVFIRVLGVMGALYFAAGLNLVVAFGGWFLSRFSGIAVEEEGVAVAVEDTEAVAVEVNGRSYVLIAAFFMSGLISIGYELLWMRSIVHLLGGFTYVFSAVLSVYLLGNVIGAGIGSRLARRLKRPAAGFALTMFLLGVCGIFYLRLLILWTSRALPHVNVAIDAIYSGLSVSAYLIGPIVHSLFLFLVPAVIMGIGFPIALQGWANHVHKVGRSTGTAYGANTIGAVIGGIVTGFVLIPLLGLQLSISILGLAGVWIGGIMWLLFARGSKVVGWKTILVVAVLLTILTVRAPSDLFKTIIKINPLIETRPLVAVKEGVTTTVSLHRDLSEGTLHMYSAGQSIAGDNYALRGDQKVLGHFGVLLNSSARKVLSVGFGSGETAACLARHELERVDCVEIAPEVVEVSLEFFTHINLGERLEEEVNMIFMDAKNYIRLTDDDYDSIVNDSIHPRDFAENASLYAREYFESARERLNDNGMIVSWLPTYDMPASVFASIIGTLMDVFPHVTLWYLTPNPAPLILLVGSERQQYFSVRHIEDALLKEGVRESLSEINIYNSVDVLSCYIGDEEDLRKSVTDFSINSDYRPFVEFTTDSKTPANQIFRRFVMDVRGESVYEHIDWGGFGEEEKEEWLADYRQLYEASSFLFMARSSTDNLEKLKYSIDGLGVLPESPALIRTRAETERRFFDVCVRMILTGKTDNALSVAHQIIKVYPQSATAWMVRSNAMRQALLIAQKRAKRSVDSSDERLNLDFFVNALADVLIIDEKAGPYDGSEAVRFAELSGGFTGYNEAQMLYALAAVYGAAGRYDEAIAAAEKGLDIAMAAGRGIAAARLTKQVRSFKAKRSSQQQR
jgi:spermidine synthase